MIRRSAAVAAMAGLLSLLLHMTGLTVTMRHPPEPSDPQSRTDTVAMGTAFEDMAEPVSEPAPPDPAPVPEPPVQPTPDSAQAVTPTTEALVASQQPREVISPDSGDAQTVEPVAPGPPDAAVTSSPETTAPAPGAETATADTPPNGAPQATPQPVEATPAPAPQQTAALTPPVAPTPADAAIPVVPVTPDTVDPVPQDSPDAPEADTADPDATALAVATSPRPRLPQRRPTPEPEGQPDGTAAPGSLQTPPDQLIESPLTTYRRDGVDVIGGQTDGSRSSARGSGNSNITNYAGQVLQQLNRAPAVRLSTQGFARVMFEINDDGTLAWVDIIDSSGSERVDLAAKMQVRNAAPFPPPPPGASRRMVFVYQTD